MLSVYHAFSSFYLNFKSEARY